MRVSIKIFACAKRSAFSAAIINLRLTQHVELVESCLQKFTISLGGAFACSAFHGDDVFKTSRSTRPSLRVMRLHMIV